MEVTVPSLAKLNLDLRVLGIRPDGYHELRTIYQTISLSDSLTISYEPARQTSIELVSSVEIPNNLVEQAARLVCERLDIRGHIRLALEKRIPMGAGLGGGSSNAASVLIALPALAGIPASTTELAAIGSELGSDVPFFLYGGTALGIGRGDELYPIPEQPQHSVVVVSTGVHVSTSEAYRKLKRSVTNALTSQSDLPILREFQAIAWTLHIPGSGRLALTNDFEKPVFRAHREVGAAVRQLKRLGAYQARMSGSGSAVYGLFASARDARKAAGFFPIDTAFPVRFVTRYGYHVLWRRALGPVSRKSCVV